MKDYITKSTEFVVKKKKTLCTISEKIKLGMYVELIYEMQSFGGSGTCVLHTQDGQWLKVNPHKTECSYRATTLVLTMNISGRPNMSND